MERVLAKADVPTAHKKINCTRGEDWRSNTGPVIPSLHGALQSSCFAPCRHALPRSHAIHPSQLKRHVSWLGGLTLSSVHKGGGREMHALHWRRLKKKASKKTEGCCLAFVAVVAVVVVVTLRILSCFHWKQFCGGSATQFLPSLRIRTRFC